MLIKIISRLAVILFSLLIVTGANADIADSDLPTDVSWYAHADLKEMKSSVTGRYILDFLEKEVFSELRNETGIDLSDDLEAAMIFGGQGAQDGSVVLFGKISDKNRTKMQALMEIYGEYDRETSKGVELFSINKRDADQASDDKSDMFSESRTTYLAFGKRGQTMISQSRSQIDAFTKEGGRVARGENPQQAGKLLVLKASNGLVKAGMNAGAGVADGEHWNSQILQHMDQVGLVLADRSGNAALDIQLVTKKPELAESIKNILQGLIAIKALDQDEDPKLMAILRSVKLESSGAMIRASAEMDPEVLKKIFD